MCRQVWREVIWKSKKIVFNLINLSDGDIPEIVRALICEVEERGLDVPSIYQQQGSTFYKI